MATFIRKHTSQHEGADGTIVVKERNHTKAELAEIRKTDPSRFITVPESHAASVIRPQMRYQEVEDEAYRSTDDREEAARSSRRSSRRGKSNRGSAAGATSSVGKAGDADGDL